MTWTREHDGTYSCTEHGASFASGRSCPRCTPGDSPLVADVIGSTQLDPEAGGESTGILTLGESLAQIAQAARRQRRIARDARRIGRESDGMDEETQARRQLRLSSLNVESQAADRELKALRAAAEYAVEAEKIASKDRLVVESRRQREADGMGAAN